MGFTKRATLRKKIRFRAKQVELTWAKRTGKGLMLAEGGANVIMRLSGRKLKKIDFACRSTAKNRQKILFFRFFQKGTRTPLYIKKKKKKKNRLKTRLR